MEDQVKHQSFSFVIPCYNEAKNIPIFIKRLSNVLAVMGVHNYEIIFVNDGSSDDTLDVLLSMVRHNPHLVIIDLTRNFGKEAALTAGLLNASGDFAVPMDADLQDPPELLPEMVKIYSANDVDAVLCRRVDRRGDNWFKAFTAKLFYKCQSFLFNPSLPPNVGDFRLVNRQILNAIKEYPETCRFMKGLFASAGFRWAFLDYTRPPRNSGMTKFNFWKLWNFALDGITGYSTFPLRIWTYIGLFSAILAILYAIFITIYYLFNNIAVPGYASIILLILFFGSMQLISLGLIGEYLGRTYMESKRRPVYTIRKIYRSE